MTTATRHIFAQRVFLFLGMTFSIFLLSSLVQRSSGRRPLFSSSGTDMQSQSAADQSAVTIQDFHRVETKAGTPVWEVKAAEARFLSSTGVTNVAEMDLIVYREDGSKVFLNSDSARLVIIDGSISKVELAGNVKVKLEDGTTVLTDSAVYIAEAEEVRSVSDVEIFGNGFLIQGKGMIADLNDRYIRLEHNVRSKFIKGLLDSNKLSAVGNIVKE
ncbi:MAG: LPS export ABC transporter periplasmic protein LptC [bacterium]|nr:LPS export ABC transporter periplasmic protein LptC [bacterium]